MQVAQNLNYALRQMRKNPAFAFIAILTLAIGIGATTAIFSLVNAVLLRPLPYEHPDRLVSINMLVSPPNAGPNAASIPGSTSYPDFFDWRCQNRSFESMASYNTGSLILNAAGTRTAQSLSSATISSDFFHVLRISPALGRSFTRTEEAPGSRVAILSHELWVSGFGSSPSIIGSTIQLSEANYTVVGVLPADASFPMVGTPDPSVWVPISQDANGKNPSTQQRGWNQVSVVARLKPGVTAAQAQAEMNVIQRAIAAKYPDSDHNEYATQVVPELDDLVGDAKSALHVLFAAVTALLLIACANVAGLLLARGSRRRPEIAIRAALGAAKTQIVSQLLVESITLSLLGGIAGALLAQYLLKIGLRLVPGTLPRIDHISIDGTVLAFAFGISMLTGIVFGLLPARRLSQIDPAIALRDGSRTSTAGRGQIRLHAGLVILETALGLTLLVGAGLLIRSFIHLVNSDPGFNPQQLLAIRIGLPSKRYPAGEQQRVQLYDRILPRLGALPGVSAVTGAYPIPMSGGDIDLNFTIEGRPVEKGDEPDGRATLAEPNFFQVMGISLIRGRTLTARDNQLEAPKVIVINQALVQRYFPNDDPIGKRIRTGFDDSDGEKSWRTIVGIVRNVKRLKLSEGTTPEYYIPYGQVPVAQLYVAMRVAGDPLSYANAARTVVAGIDPDLPVYGVRTLKESIGLSTAQQRFQALLLTGFAAVALLLAAIGLYAILTYIVIQRTHEIGLRMALGAQRSNVLRLILARGMLLAVAGIGLGIITSAILTRFLATQLYGVRPLDPLTFVSVAALLLAISATASWIPAQRASRLDPITTLRDQ